MLNVWAPHVEAPTQSTQNRSGTWIVLPATGATETRIG